MWCSSADTPRQVGSVPEPHHRIVRIPPGESIVLNSAERAPYLLLIEIVHSDLDFDPSKRSNREVLKKILLKEEEGRGGYKDLTSFKSREPLSLQRQESLPLMEYSSSALGSDVSGRDREPNGSGASNPYIASNKTLPSGDEEEVDLVEQLYGADETLRSRSIDLAENVMLPLPPKNKELDMAAWSDSTRNTSAGPSQVQQSISDRSETTQSRRENASSRVLSLDEYSERMRTAAVMLAQLNSSLMRESIIASGGSAAALDSPSPLRWVPGANWLTGSSASGSQQPGRDQPGPSIASPMPQMRLQPMEAQAIRNRIMSEMLALEEERMERMRENRESEGFVRLGDVSGSMKTAEDEGIIRRELSKADPSAIVFSESWTAKKVRALTSYSGLCTNWSCCRVEYDSLLRTAT